MFPVFWPKVKTWLQIQEELRHSSLLCNVSMVLDEQCCHGLIVSKKHKKIEKNNRFFL